MLTEPIPILFIHAFPLDSTMWRTQVGGLRGLRLLTPDLRGFGRNHRLPLFDSIDAHAKDLAALLDQSSIERALVVGLSMGGYIALALVKLFPHRVAGLVLANTRAEPDTDIDRRKREAMIEQVTEVGTSLLPNVMLPGLVSSSCGDSLRETIREMILRQPRQGVIAAIRSLRDRCDARGTLTQIHCPTAFVGGEFDLLSPPSFQRSMSHAVPGSTMVVIPGVGHLSNMEAPLVFNKVICDVHDRIKQVQLSGGRC